MYELKAGANAHKGDILVFDDGRRKEEVIPENIGKSIPYLMRKFNCRVLRHRPSQEPTPAEPQVTYHGKTTVVRFPDGTIESAKPCKAQPKRNGRPAIKADKFDPMTGFLHCLAKKHYGSEYKRFIDNAVQETGK